MKSPSILIKPSSSNCNLRCKYCFYRSIADSRQKGSYGLMTTETLEQLVKNALGNAEGYCCFAFQGGEPTLVGLSFYRRLVAFEQQYNTRGLTVEHTIQTNGIQIDDEWAQFFAENHFLVGLSLDGPRKLHDAHRVATGDGGTFDDVMRAVDVLTRHRVDFNVLSVVTARSALSAEYMYRFFRKQGFPFLQFIPCLDEHPGQTAEYSLQPGQYGRFLIKMFELWEKDFTAGAHVEIRFFTNLIQMAAGYPAEACGMCGHCTPYPVVEGDGGVYPCDFYVTDEWRLGDVHTPLDVLLQGEKARAFAAPSARVSEKCKDCDHFQLCRGGCRRWREPVMGGTPSLNCLCEDYKLFFDACHSKILDLAHRYLTR